MTFINASKVNQTQPCSHGCSKQRTYAQTMNKYALIGALLTSVSFAQTMPPEPKNIDLKSLNQLEYEWKQQRISNYTFTLERSCFCAPRVGSFDFKVRRGVGRLVKASSGIDPKDFQKYSSINALFVEARKLLKNGGRIAVVMDKNLRHPIQITFDSLPQATDDELYLTISKFKR
jgi:hypothetical protein